MELSTLLGKMLVFAVLMLIGYLMARRGAIGPAFTRTASSLVLNVFMVGTILNSMISTGAERDLSNLPEIILMTFMMTLIGYATAWLVTRLVRIEPDNAPSFEILMGVGNSMFIALPIAGALYGAYAVFIVSLSCIPFNVFLYSYGVWRIRGTESGKLRVKDMFSIPLIATLLGLLILVLDLSVPKVIVDIFSSLSGATMPMSMMVIGASLGSVSLLDAFRNPKLADSDPDFDLGNLPFPHGRSGSAYDMHDHRGISQRGHCLGDRYPVRAGWCFRLGGSSAQHDLLDCDHSAADPDLFQTRIRRNEHAYSAE